MVITPQTLLAAAALFVAVFVLGFLLRRSGKPFSGLVLTAHKLISLAVLTSVFFVIAIVSGGLASTEKPESAIVLTLHRITPFVTIAGAPATFFLLP